MPIDEHNVRAQPSWPIAAALGVCVLSLASVWLPKLAPASIVLVLVLLVAAPKRSRQRLQVISLLVLAVVAATIGFVRFVRNEAIPGIIQGGQQAMGRVALSRLRQLVFAQDTLRKQALIDPDADGIGGAAWIGELSGVVELRGPKALPEALLLRHEGGLVQTSSGPAMSGSGYLFIVCLPKTPAGFTALPTETIDEERAERRFLAYAWPATREGGSTGVFFIDEHERILQFEPPAGHESPYIGRVAPPCDAALDATDARWQPWRAKRPRALLPGDRP